MTNASIMLVVMKQLVVICLPEDLRELDGVVPRHRVPDDDWPPGELIHGDRGRRWCDGGNDWNVETVRVRDGLLTKVYNTDAEEAMGFDLPGGGLLRWCVSECSLDDCRRHAPSRGDSDHPV